MWKMSGGHEVDVGEEKNKTKKTRPQVYCVRICSWALSLSPYLPTSTSYPQEIVHSKYSQTFPILSFTMYYTDRKLKNNNYLGET